jgi:hypothetical protein
MANSIILAPSADAKRGAVRAFINSVNAQHEKALSGLQANELIALSRII